MPDYTLDGQGPFFCRPNPSTEDPTKNRMVKDLDMRCIMQETGYTWGFNVSNCEHGVLSACTYVNPAHGKAFDVNRVTITSGEEFNLSHPTQPTTGSLRPRNLLLYDVFAHKFGFGSNGDFYFQDQRIGTAGKLYITLVNCYQKEVSDITFENSDDRFALMQARYSLIFDNPPTSAILDGDFSGYKAKAGGVLDRVETGIKIGAMDHWNSTTKRWVNPRTEITLSNISVTPSTTEATVTFDTTSTSNGNIIYCVHNSGEQIYNGHVEAGHNQDGTAAVATGTQAVTGTTQQSISVTGLTSGTDYRISIIQIGSDGYRSKIASRPSGVPLADDFTTT